ncbi:uncharacterized protein G2W53_032767 [Senna tora]|uniref:Uncharacterized protein n=1 Tax=Senna tora TaxID=362788 RepID=A0A834WAG2_9FABA|nr:uncharacterized protein G2W53_032767 [Senna tora]
MNPKIDSSVDDEGESRSEDHSMASVERLLECGRRSRRNAIAVVRQQPCCSFTVDLASTASKHPFGLLD